MLPLGEGGAIIWVMDISLIFQQMAVMLILLVVGVVAARTGVIDGETNRRMTRFALAIPQSAQILSSAMNMQTGMSLGRVMGLLGAGWIYFAVLILLSLGVPFLYRVKGKDRGVYSFMTIFGNMGFMGLPVIRSIFGDTAVFYGAILLIPFNIIAYTYGVMLLQGGKGRIDWKALVSVPLISAFISVVLVCVHIPIPYPIRQATTLLGDMITPLSMIIIGASLGELPLGEVLGDWRSYAFAPVRLIASPVLIWAVMGLFTKDPTLLGVYTVLAAMPVATFATMLSIRYGGNERLTSRTVFVTTVLSVATIPLVCWMLPLGG